MNYSKKNNILNVNNKILDLVFADMKCLGSRGYVPLVPYDQPHHPALFIECRELRSSGHLFAFSAGAKTYNFQKVCFPALYEGFLLIVFIT